MKNILTLTIVSIFTLSLSAQNSDKRLKGIEKEFEKVLETFKTPGFAVAVVEKDKVVYAEGFGYSDYEKKVKADANTLYAIGSCTKAFTSSIIGMLEHDGKLSFDDKPAKYIPGFSFFNDDMNNQIKIKDLMCHRTGLPRHDFSWYFFPGKSKKDLLERVEYQEPFSGIREQWYYNNFMYLAQGVITEEITGRSWEENIRERIFKPLGMVRSNLSIDELEESENVAVGYELKNKEEIKKMEYYRIAKMSPAGSINSSVNEMANWLITWINNGRFGDEEIIPSGFRTQAISSQMVVNAGLPTKESPDMHMTNYGFGWFLSSYKGHYRVEHGGNIDGFSASTSFYPSDSIGVIVLVNQNGSAVSGTVRNLVSDRMLGVHKTDWVKQIKEQLDKAILTQEEAGKSASTDKKEGTSPSHELTNYTGIYRNDGYGGFEIYISGDSLYAKLPLRKIWLEHYHYDVFEPHEVVNAKVDTASGQLRFNFETNNTGDISGLKIAFEPALDPLFFKRLPKEVEVNRETLEQYAGEYDIAGAIASVFIKDETLYVNVPGQPDYELLSIGKHEFTFKDIDGYKVIFTEEDGLISALTFIQPQGNFTAKKK